MSSPAPAAAAPLAPDPAAPILFFDSGIGGLSVLAPTLALLPSAPIVYATDHAGLPYGEKSEAEIATRVSALLGRLVERVRPRLAVIACNTASTIALAHVRAALDTPFVGTVPAIKPAAEMSRSRVIGILGTAATIRQPYVDQLSAQFAPDCTIIRQAAPELVFAAEAALSSRRVDTAAIERAVHAMRSQPGGADIDVVVLACTHFPLLSAQLSAILGPAVRLIDGGPGIARRIATLTTGQGWPESAPARYVITNGGIDAVQRCWPHFAAHGFSHVSAL